MPEPIPITKNTKARKDADGNFYLFIEAGDLKATFLLSADEGKDTIERRCLAAWLAEQSD